MKKLFIKETGDVVELGDVVTIHFYKEIEDGTVTVDRDIEITPDTVSLLIDLGFIEEDDVENDLIDFNESEEDCCEERGRCG